MRGESRESYERKADDLDAQNCPVTRPSAGLEGAWLVLALFFRSLHFETA